MTLAMAEEHKNQKAYISEQCFEHQPVSDVSKPPTMITCHNTSLCTIPLLLASLLILNLQITLLEIAQPILNLLHG